MRKLLSSHLPFVLVFIGHYVSAQTPTCFTDQLTNQMMANDPAYAAAVNDLRNNYIPQPNALGRAVRTISVKVHVVYNTTAENVSQTLIDNMITTLNQDYRRQNPNAVDTRSQFVSVAADAQIDFCLDQVVRVSTTYSCFDPSTQSDDMKTISPTIDPSHFLNIWIVDICGTSGGGVAGYAYFPTTGMPGSSIDGLVLDYQLGLLGNEHAATHEIGHYFGLEHTFAGCGTHANSCSDIPEQSQPNYPTFSECAPTNTSCGSLDQSDNYMDYATCPNMFTICQANYMNSILSTRRASLLSSTGCSSSAGGPTADFTSNKTSGCPGTLISFTDQSLGNPTSWSWTFQGGSPSSSSQQNPVITYNSAGTYNVTLTVSNTNGNDSETKTAYITILSANSLPLVEGFESATFPPTGWTLLNPDNSDTWERSTQASGFGQSNACALVDNYNYDGAGQKDWLITPVYNFSGVTTARLKFDYAHARYSSSYIDSLIIAYSTNCGASFTTLWKKGGSGLATTTDKTIPFYPTSGQWKKDSIDLSSLAGQSNVQFAFINVNGYGNSVLIDNINIYAVSSTGQAPVADFSGSPLSIPVGGIVNFTDLSVNNPTGWNWSFPGGNPSSSTIQNPAGIQYNAAGTYHVTLTASNTYGNNAKTKTNYITVTVPTATTCDTITNVSATDTLIVYTSTSGGYVSGHNSYGDLAKADKYIGQSGAVINGAIFYFGVATYGSPTSKVTAKVWDANGTGGSPGTQLAAQDILLSTIAVDVSNDDLTPVIFSSPPTITGDFFVGIEFTYAAGDTVALVSNLDGETTPPTAWEKFSNGQWYRYDNSSSWGLNVAHVILPIVCTSAGGPVPVASFTANKQTVCEGQAVTFTDHSTNSPTSWNWLFNGGSPSTSTSQNPVVTYNNSGSYAVLLQVSNNNGADTFYTAGYITVNDVPVANITVAPVSCNGGNNGSASLSVSGGTPPFGYQWSNGATIQNLTGLSAGTYTVSISDNKSCTATASRSVTQPTALTTSITSIPADCGVANGTASAAVSGGTAPYSYLWSNGATSQVAAALTAGNYSVTIFDANSCQALKSFTLANAGAPAFTTSKVDVLCFGQNTGSASLNVTGGNQPYTYQWSNGQSDSAAIGLAAGAYTVTVMDSRNCSVLGNINIFQPSQVSVTTQTTPDNGSGNGTATLTVGGGISPYTYLWSSGQTTQSVSGMSTGNYTVTVTDNNGCFIVEPVTISGFVGIATSDAETSIRIYPNPSQGKFNLEIKRDGEWSVEVYDIVGKRIYLTNKSVVRSNKVLMDLSIYPAGTYYVKTHTSDFSAVEKLFKTD